MTTVEVAMPTVLVPTLDEPNYVPDDPLFSGGTQWYLYDNTNPVSSLNISAVWDDYSGAGVTIGFVDDGIDYNHPDLVANLDPSMGENFVSHQVTTPNDGRPFDNSDRHGTTVAGVAVASDNSIGVVGVAFGATGSALRIGYGSDHTIAQVQQAFQEAVNFDIFNNSWGYSGYFYDNFNDLNSFGGAVNPFVAVNDGLINALANGRPHSTDANVNLGTVVVVASGNERFTNSGQIDQNVNYHSLTSSPHTITVAGLAQSGFDTEFATPGAAVLLAGPASSVGTTDLVGDAGFSVGSDYTNKGGTSYAAPAVSGVIALMLEANPDLGYRDVQEILTLSSQFADPNDSAWMINAAGDWNGGGKHVSDELGFGSLDAHGAVRLAETWEKLSTYANLAQATVSSGTLNETVDRETYTHTLTVADQGIDLDQVVLTLNMNQFRIGEMKVTLTSPGGTTSVLIDYPGGGGSYVSAFIDEFEMSSVQYWGEEIAGDWTLKVTDTDFNPNDTVNHTALVKDYSLTFLGDTASDDDLYVYTSEYGEFGVEAARQTLTDTAGIDTVNFATLTSGVTIDLTPGVVNTFEGNPLTFALGTIIEKAFGGDGDDNFTGNAADNHISAMRGDDTVSGGAGDDTLDGGAGYDIAVYSGNLSSYALTLNPDDTLIVQDLIGSEGTDTLTGIELVRFADVDYLVGDPIGTPDLDRPEIILPEVTHIGTNQNSQYVGGDGNANVLATGGGSWNTLDGKGGDDAYIIYNPNVIIKDTSFQGTDTFTPGR